jgi:hypothetical protein
MLRDEAKRTLWALGRSVLHRETHALGQKGICRLKVHAPRVIQETDYVLRLVSLGATLRYPILSQRYVDECGAGDLDPGAGDGGQSGLGAGS